MDYSVLFVFVLSKLLAALVEAAYDPEVRRTSNSDLSDKMRENQTHTLVVMVSTNEPFVIDETNTLKGIDILLLKTFAQKMNQRIEFVHRNQSLDDAFSTECSFYHFRHKLHRSDVDVFAGGLSYSSVIEDYMVASIPYEYNEFTWCVQKSRPIPLWLNSFKICKDKILWVMFVIQIIMLLVVAYVLQMNEQHKVGSHMLILVGAANFFCLPTTYRPESAAVRFYFISVIFAGMLYSIILITTEALVVLHPILTMQIATVDQLVDYDLKLMGNQFTYTKILPQKERYSDIFFKYELCNDIDLCIKQLETDDALAVAVSRERALNNRLLHRDKMFCFAENIQTQPISLILRKHYPFENDLNEFIVRATEAGFFVKWKKDSRLKYEHEVFGTQYMKLDHLYGAMLAAFLMLILATFVFITERVAYRRAHSSNATRFWKLVEILMNPDRSFMLESFEHVEITKKHT